MSGGIEDPKTPVTVTVHTSVDKKTGKIKKDYKYEGGVETITDSDGAKTYRQAIRPKEVSLTNVAYLKVTPEMNNATIVQNNRASNSLDIIGTEQQPVDGDRIIQIAPIVYSRKTLMNYIEPATMEIRNAHHINVTQNSQWTSLIIIDGNVQNSTVHQENSNDTKALILSNNSSTRDNYFDGGKIARYSGNDLILEGKREEYKFTFNKDGTFSFLHKPTGMNPGTFAHYNKVSFYGEDLSLAQLKSSQAKLDADELAHPKLPVKNQEHQPDSLQHGGVKPVIDTLIKH